MSLSDFTISDPLHSAYTLPMPLPLPLPLQGRAPPLEIPWLFLYDWSLSAETGHPKTIKEFTLHMHRKKDSSSLVRQTLKEGKGCPNPTIVTTTVRQHNGCADYTSV